MNHVGSSCRMPSATPAIGLGSFLRRPENEIACSAIARLLNEPTNWGAHELSPLFIWGPAGCGKSLLVRELVASLEELHSGLSVKRFEPASWLATPDSPWTDGQIDEDLRADFWVVEDVHRFIGD